MTAPVVLSPEQRKLLVESLREWEGPLTVRMRSQARELAALLEGAESVVITKGSGQ